MRLVDADELTFDRLTDSICQGQAEDVVAEAPTIDAVPVVRCGECKYSGESLFYPTEMACKYHLGHTYYTEPDRFCYFGERRTDEHN